MAVILGDLLPPAAGLYVAYVNDNPPSRFAARIILLWDGTKWYYPHSDQRFRAHVHQWIGPLPVMRLEDEKSG